MDVEGVILEIVKDRFMSITQIHKELLIRGFTLNHYATYRHVIKMEKIGEVFSVIGENGKPGVKPPLFKALPEL